MAEVEACNVESKRLNSVESFLCISTFWTSEAAWIHDILRLKTLFLAFMSFIVKTKRLDL